MKVIKSQKKKNISHFLPHFFKTITAGLPPQGKNIFFIYKESFIMIFFSTEKQPLKVLHFFLDHPEVSFVGITNEPFDNVQKFP